MAVRRHKKEILPQLFSTEFNLPTGLKEHIKSVKYFLEDVFGLNSTNANELKNFQLEDLFTVLDRCIINQEKFGKYQNADIIQIRKSLGVCINSLISQKLESKMSPFYDELANAILKQRVNAGQEKDPFAFIVLNWDILLDNAIFRTYKHSTDPKIQKCCIDYCCYSTPLGMPDHNHRSIEVKAKGLYNLKIQKLHGSLNWLTCTDCSILFYRMEEKIALREINDEKCPSPCPRQSLLKSLLIEPTFVKDLNNTHLRMIWHNALLDLMDAERIVFIGYSLPVADVEFRYLLKKRIDKESEIKVILTKTDERAQSIENYKSFFGSQLSKDSFDFNGSASFLQKEFNFGP